MAFFAICQVKYSNFLYIFYIQKKNKSKSNGKRNSEESRCKFA